MTRPTFGYTSAGGPPVGTGAGTVAAGDDPRIVAVATIPADRGYRAWNLPVHGANGAVALTTAGTLYLMRIERVPAGPVTNIEIHCTAAGVSLTAGQCFAALFTAAGARIGATADQSTPWASIGAKTMPLVGGPFTVTVGPHYVGLWFNGTTGPTLTRYTNAIGNSVILNAGTSTPNFIAAAADTGLTTAAPANFTMSAPFSAQWWVALS